MAVDYAQALHTTPFFFFNPTRIKDTMGTSYLAIHHCMLSVENHFTRRGHHDRHDFPLWWDFNKSFAVVLMMGDMLISESRCHPTLTTVIQCKQCEKSDKNMIPCSLIHARQRLANSRRFVAALPISSFTWTPLIVTYAHWWTRLVNWTWGPVNWKWN